LFVARGVNDHILKSLLQLLVHSSLLIELIPLLLDYFLILEKLLLYEPKVSTLLRLLIVLTRSALLAIDSF
jgi:hypothetical protein